MKSILVIGVGRFGQHISTKFAELGNDVMAMDISEERIHDILPFVSEAKIGDCTKREVLEEIGVNNFDICIVSLSDLGESLECTYLLKELNAPYIISRANHDLHANLLLRSGASEVVYPEKQIAERIAVKHTAVKVFDYIEITSDFSICEIPVPKEWVGRALEEINVRKHHHVNILAFNQNDYFVETILPSHVFIKDEHLMVFGRKENIIKLSNKL